ncbi:MAG: enoyl-CoA hydratase/isomerase family protein [Actinomycetia bacterium]|nr:enoyl-CoA hydratase/isomerase family protein [Actinomycetes bacterium]MCP3913388.1 enoyl-CoA hydratase/isomerase family protein [Actinomycetes bacterium]MCP4086286.1 enoyl-CoA hydratase/isomerase family protein [Actinomycetes bacterium]
MIEPVVIYEVSDHIATITINRPEAYNSLNYEAYRLLTESLNQANIDPDVRAIVFTGRGRGFCTGDDVKELLGQGAAELSRRITSGELELPSGPMHRSDRPIIAAVNGPAVGYGMELSLLADIRIASTDAKFSEMFVKRAIMAGPDSFEILPRLIGPAAAAEMLLTGDLIDAQQALDWGLVTKVVAPDQLADEARDLAARMTANAPLAVQAGKQALRLVRGGKGEELRSHASRRLGELLASRDHQESVAAFLEKRDPSYEGR